MKIVVVPFEKWGAVSGGILILVLLITFFSRQKVKSGWRKHQENSDSSWHIPSLGRRGKGSSFIGELDPRCKIISLLFLAFAAVFTYHFRVLFGFFLISATLFAFSRLPFRSFFRRILPVVFFVLILAVIMPITVPAQSNDIVVTFEHVNLLKINLSTFRLVFKVFFKAFIVLLLMPVLLETSPYPTTIMAMKRLGLPESVAQMLILSYRYIFVFRDEAARMLRSMKLRGFRLKTSLATLATIGNFLGLLFVRSYERTQRIYEAMVAKGYRGTFPILASFKVRKMDVVFLVGISTLVALGLIIDNFVLLG